MGKIEYGVRVWSGWYVWFWRFDEDCTAPYCTALAMALGESKAGRWSLKSGLPK